MLDAAREAIELVEGKDESRYPGRAPDVVFLERNSSLRWTSPARCTSRARSLEQSVELLEDFRGVEQLGEHPARESRSRSPSLSSGTPGGHLTQKDYPVDVLGDPRSPHEGHSKTAYVDVIETLEP